MTPNIRFDLQLEPTHFMMNGVPFTLSGKYTLLPDNQVKHLHKRVLCIARDDRNKVPFYGTVVGRVKKDTEYYYLVQNEISKKIERVTRPQVADSQEPPAMPAEGTVKFRFIEALK